MIASCFPRLACGSHIVHFESMWSGLSSVLWPIFGPRSKDDHGEGLPTTYTHTFIHTFKRFLCWLVTDHSFSQLCLSPIFLERFEIWWWQGQTTRIKLVRRWGQVSTTQQLQPQQQRLAKSRPPVVVTSPQLLLAIRMRTTKECC